jgi:hypothetical protein
VRLSYILDADGNGTADALSDGILILRYLFGPGGAWNVADALGSGATRATRAQIKAILDQFNPAASPAPGNDLGAALATRGEIKTCLDQFNPAASLAPADDLLAQIASVIAISKAADQRATDEILASWPAK